MIRIPAKISMLLQVTFMGVTQEVDVIVANILADILIHLTEDAYSSLVKDDKLFDYVRDYS